MSTKEQVFKKGDSVFHFIEGWGKIISEDVTFPMIKWDNNIFETYAHIKLLSFTEYTLEGFSQERPEELPNEGEIAWVRNELPGNWAIGHFYKKIGDYYYVSDYVGQKEWSKRGLEITTKNPYDKSNV